MWVITVDDKQGYHHVKTRACDVETFAFFAPSYKTYGFQVMPVGPVNAPVLYTCMMGNLKTKWDALLIEMLTIFANNGVKLDGVIVRIRWSRSHT